MVFEKLKSKIRTDKPWIDRVKYDGPANVLAWRLAQDNLSWGTQVIVNQSQEALFYKGGQALDLLGPGTHTLKTANIPFLRDIIAIPFGDETPFAAEVYFVNKAVNLDVKWGTKDPLMIEDPKYGVMLPVRAFGQFGIKVEDARKFVVELVGTVSSFDSATLVQYFRGVVLTKAKDRIAEVLVKEKIPILEISAYLDDISTQLREPISAEFGRFGLGIVNFYLNSISVPQDDEAVVRLRDALSKRAEFNIIGDERYRMERTFDTLETAAGNEGQAGSVMGAGMGMGMGVGMGMPMGQMAGQMMGQAGVAGGQPGVGGGGMPVGDAPPAAAGGGGQVQCSNCGAAVSATAKFCGECGQQAGPATVACVACQAQIAPGSKFCGECGAKQEAPAAAACPECNAEIEADAKFCGECGHKMGE
jgi:membrane protease subunit (stomatin/prohibitin family)